MFLAHGASLDLKNAAGEIAYDCIANENSQCARAIEFNMRIREIAKFDDQHIVCQ